MNKLKKWINYRDALEIPGTNHKKKKRPENPAFLVFRSGINSLASWLQELLKS